MFWGRRTTDPLSIGTVFKDYSDDELTVLENLYIRAKFYKKSKSDLKTQLKLQKLRSNASTADTASWRCRRADIARVWFTLRYYVS